MKIIGVIPARYKSSRFPGKPLADICGKPMIWWVYNEAKKVKEFSDVIVATESQIVVDECDKYGIKVMLTSDEHPTGTDRVAEVAQKVSADYYVIIMGDEPLITSDDMRRLVAKIETDVTADAVMLTERFEYPVDVVNTTTIKLALNNKGDLIFMSRMPIPFPKAMVGYSYFKNVGCYALKKDALDFYLRTAPGKIEQAEEIELLRLLENHKKVSTVEINSSSMAVDTQKDLERVRKILGNMHKWGGVTLNGKKWRSFAHSMRSIYSAEVCA
ncbi:MAG: 3-deoxy-manno-octulosonate cytidylyltransferase [Clostridia bacterium]|nr:3-deoxy-manno-octulosonate cytidylyltransferase [Clostridia bacterium]